MSHRHATDRIETVVVAQCPNDCDVAYSLEGEGKEQAVDDLVERVTEMFDVCPTCGDPMGVLRKTDPVEVLE